MPQKNDLAEKRRLLFDGEEKPGLVKMGEFSLENGTIEVPEVDSVSEVQNGVTKIPPLEATYKIQRNGNVDKFFRDYFINKEVKDITVIRMDASGVEFGRFLLQGCECVKYSYPEYAAESPTYANVPVKFVPYKYIPL